MRWYNADQPDDNQLALDYASCPHVFVYGTLKSKQGNNGILSGSICLGATESLTEGVLYDCGFPYAIHGVTAVSDALRASVRGEVYLIDDLVTFEMLDSLEFHPHHYYRTQVDTKLGIRAWMYFLPTEPTELKLCPIVEGAYQWRD